MTNSAGIYHVCVTGRRSARSGGRESGRVWPHPSGCVSVTSSLILSKLKVKPCRSRLFYSILNSFDADIFMPHIWCIGCIYYEHNVWWSRFGPFGKRFTGKVGHSQPALRTVDIPSKLLWEKVCGYQRFGFNWVQFSFLRDLYCFSWVFIWFILSLPFGYIISENSCTHRFWLII